MGEALLSNSALLAAPTEGRSAIATTSSGTGNFFNDLRYASLEGLEVMMMYGYELKLRDFEYSFFPLAFVDSNKRMLKVAFAAGFATTLKLERCLGMAIGNGHASFDRAQHHIVL